MKSCMLVLVVFAIKLNVMAQTWTGNTSTDWNTASNWSGNAIPAAGGNVTIPTSPSGSRFPVLATDITINSLTMQPDAQLDVNGKSITANSINIYGKITSTPNASSIIFNVTGSATSYVRNTQFLKPVIFNLSGSGTFYDNYTGVTSNNYSGNVSFLRTGTGATYIGFYAENTYGGNVVVSNQVPSIIDLFNNGCNISGNLSVTSVGGALSLGNIGYTSSIAGTININATTSGVFSMTRLINQTSGGSITATDRSTIDIISDTIKVNQLTVSNYAGAFQFDNNQLEGNLNISSAIGTSATSFVRGNQVTGNVQYLIRGTNTFYDNYLSNTANHYTGNVTYQRTGTGATYIGYYAQNTYNGNVDVSNQVTSILDLFSFGGVINGNLSVTSLGGALVIGNINRSTNISGTVNINASAGGAFNMSRIINLLNGGSISLSGRGIVEFKRDTLKVLNIQITGQTSGFEFDNNDLTGNLNFENVSGGTTHFVRSNRISGNASYNIQGSGVFYDTYLTATANRYGGNVSYTRGSTGAMYIGYYDSVYFGGNVTFNYATTNTVDNRYIVFDGEGPSTINQDGNGVLQFIRLTMQKTGSGSLTLNDSVRISGQVYFNGGNILTANQKELIFLSGSNAVGASDGSHVIGPVVKTGANAFTFPVGVPALLKRVGMTAPSGSTSRFRAQYFPMNPHPTYDTSQRAAGLASMGACEYWRVDRETGTTNVALTFDFGQPCPCVEVPANLRVARWTGSQWANLGGTSVTGASSKGTVTTSAGVADYGIFSLGSSATVSPSVVIARNVPNPVCLCRKVTFTATPSLAGCAPTFVWRKNNVVVGNNTNVYEDSTLVQGDVIQCTVNSSAAFAVPASASGNSLNITTTDLNTWTGLTNTNWHAASNWSCQSVPCEGSSVTVPTGTPNAAEIIEKDVIIKSIQVMPSAILRVLNQKKLTLKPPQ